MLRDARASTEETEAGEMNNPNPYILKQSPRPEDQCFGLWQTRSSFNDMVALRTPNHHVVVGDFPP